MINIALLRASSSSIANKNIALNKMNSFVDLVLAFSKIGTEKIREIITEIEAYNGWIEYFPKPILILSGKCKKYVSVM